jgi:hypothetical protein
MVGKAGKLFFNFFFKDRLLKRLLQEKNCPFTPLLKLRILPAHIWKSTHCPIRNITRPDFVCLGCQCFKIIASIRQKSYCLKKIWVLCKKKLSSLLSPDIEHSSVQRLSLSIEQEM